MRAFLRINAALILTAELESHALMENARLFRTPVNLMNNLMWKKKPVSVCQEQKNAKSSKSAFQKGAAAQKQTVLTGITNVLQQNLQQTSACATRLIIAEA